MTKPHSCLNWILLILLLVCLIGISLPGYGHGGRTNAEGCHKESKTQTRHCHNKKGKTGNSKNGYDRKSWSFSGKKFPAQLLGFYTNKSCEINADHVVALKDAHDSGGKNWTSEQKQQFANDPLNLVPSCKRVNSSKSHLGPAAFCQRSTDNRGVEVDWTQQRWREYMLLYIQVKKKYNLSLANNNPAVVAATYSCQ